MSVSVYVCVSFESRVCAHPINTSADDPCHSFLPPTQQTQSSHTNTNKQQEIQQLAAQSNASNGKPGMIPSETMESQAIAVEQGLLKARFGYSFFVVTLSSPYSSIPSHVSIDTFIYIHFIHLTYQTVAKACVSSS